jgi:hypothetical protein
LARLRLKPAGHFNSSFALGFGTDNETERFVAQGGVENFDAAGADQVLPVRVCAKITSDFAEGDLARWRGATKEHSLDLCE